ncbi:hypothetical protein [Streptomyces venezuelae]|uniref:hypothetical protein n=1 Tax=Streptomyces venezuelae TaxID=54571 RepID=UPI0036494CFA
MPASLPLHPLNGARALGWRKARTGEDESELHPIWPILGAAKDDDQNDDADADAEDGDTGDGDQDDDGTDDPGDGGGDEGDQDDADPEGADELGDKGKRALAAMKGKWKSERDKRRGLEQQLADKAGGDDDAVTKATAAATAAANARIMRAEVRAAAASKLADPRDALKFLDLDQFEVGEDGDVDADEIAEAIEELIKTKPYLAAATAKRFQGTGDGGAARKASRPKQLTQSDLKKMTPQQIVKAQDDGRLDDLLGTG